MDVFDPSQALADAQKEDCIFYHSMTFPDGEKVEAAWDLRGFFSGLYRQLPDPRQDTA